MPTRQPRCTLQVGKLSLYVKGHVIMRANAVRTPATLKPGTPSYRAELERMCGTAPRHQWPFTPALVFAAKSEGVPCAEHEAICRQMCIGTHVLDHMVQLMTNNTVGTYEALVEKDFMTVTHDKTSTSVRFPQKRGMIVGRRRR